MGGTSYGAEIIVWGVAHYESVCLVKRLVVLMGLLFLGACAGRSGSAELTEQQAEIVLLSNNSVDALAAFNEVLGKHPGDPRALAHRAVVYDDSGRPDLAIADLDASIRGDGGTAFSFAERALARHHAGQSTPALQDAQQAINLLQEKPGPGPSDASFAGLDATDREYALTSAHTLRAEFFRRRKQYAAALADVDAILSIDPTYTSALLIRGGIEREQGHFDAALADDLRADQFHDHTDTVLALCSDYVAGADMELAVRQCTAGIALLPKKTWGYLERATAYLKMGQASEALEDYNVAAGIFPRDSKILFGRSIARAMLGDGLGADSDRQQALQVDADAATWFRLRGLSVSQPVKT